MPFPSMPFPTPAAGVRPAPIRFYFDFASPYAYFALRPLQALARAHGRMIDYQPMLLFAVLRAQGVTNPLNAPAKHAYLMADMARSAAFHGVPYIHPAKLPFSSHAAARLFYALVEAQPGVAGELAIAIFDALFARGADIATQPVLESLAAAYGLAADTTRQVVDAPVGRHRLAAAIDRAVADGVCGSPYFIVDGEGFFGADRIPQIEWRLGASIARAPIINDEGDDGLSGLAGAGERRWTPVRPSAFTKLVGPILQSGSPEGRRYAFTVEPKHDNSLERAHGGMIMAFCDEALGMAAWQARPGETLVTIEFACHFIGGASMGDLIEMEPEVVRSSRSLVFMRGVCMSAGQVIATCSGIWKTIDRTPRAFSGQRGA